MLPQVEAGEVAVVARGSDSPELTTQTTRVLIANASAVEQKSDAIAQFLAAYEKAIDAAYADTTAQEAFAKKLELDPNLVLKAIPEYYPREALQMKEIKGLDRSMKDAVEYDYIKAPLTQEQVDELFPKIKQAQ